MTVIDPIADMLTRIRNAVLAGHTLVAMPSSKLKLEIAKIMKDEGYLEGFEVVEGEQLPQKVLRLKIKYVGERRERAVFRRLVRAARLGVGRVQGLIEATLEPVDRVAFDNAAAGRSAFR